MTDEEIKEPMERVPLILIADDVPQNLQVLANILKKYNYRISLAANGTQALEMAKRGLPDVILLDVMMPGMNGFDVCRELKKNSETSGIPIIFLTARIEVEDIVEGFEAGAVDYVTKPFRADELLARVNTQLELKRNKDRLKARNQEIELIHGQLREAYAELEADLLEAADYVISMLPQPGAHKTGKPATDWSFRPSSQLGGDIFGYHWLDNDHFAFYLLDVSGHGIGAALLSVSVMNLLSFEVLNNTDFRDPAGVLSKLNENFLAREHKGLVYTIWYGVYQRSTHRLTYSNAGHPPAVLFTGDSPKSAEPVRLTTPGILIGALPGYEYTNREFQLKDFNRLFLFSDGTYEIWKRDNGRLWTYDEWVELLQTKQTEGKGDDLNDLLKYVQDLKGSPQLEDDFSLLKIDF